LIGGTAVTFDRLYHQPFRDDGGKVVRQAFQEVASHGFPGLSARYLYAVKCAVETPNKKVLDSCSGYIRAELMRVAMSRQAQGKGSNLVILACGVNTMRALGVHVKSEKEALGRIFEGIPFGEFTATVVATRSAATYAATSGKYNTLLADVERAARVARNSEVAPITRAEAEKNYIYPKTIEEVRALVRMVCNYAEDGVDPLKWSISFDTETNTLHPHWKGFKCIAVSFSWAPGYSATVPLWHRDTPYDPDLAWVEVRSLLTCGKPLIWHNFKYDYRVLWALGFPMDDVGNPKWDSLLGEHMLEEDKKGEYSLKALTKRFYPEYSGYEDRLQAELQKSDGAVVVNTGKKEVKLPQAVADALQRMLDAKVIKSAAFRVSSVDKLLEAPTTPEEHKADLRILRAAKTNGEFSGKAQAEEAKEQKRKGGYEHSSLDELYFYAAVDADITRRLAINQSERMFAEDEKIAKWRQVLKDRLANEIPDPEVKQYKVQELCKEPHPQHRIMRDFKLPRQRELAKVEHLGVHVNRKYLKWGNQKLDQVIEAMSEQIYTICGESFTLNSPKKLSSFLFESGFKHPDLTHAQEIADVYKGDVQIRSGRVYYRPKHFTMKGATQTGAEVLKHLVSTYKCPLSNLLLALKKADKARNSFFKNADILSQMFEDEMLHGGYNLTGTATDRLSSSSGVDGVGFNYQNIPKGLLGALRDTRGDMVLLADGTPVFEGVSCKKLFIPDDPDTMCLGNADAKGAEVTIFGTYAYDFDGGAALVDALINGLDAHCFFASQALNPALVGGKLSGTERRLALEKAGIDDDHAWSYEDFGDRGKMLKKGLGKGDAKVRTTWEIPSLVEYAMRLDKLRDNIKRLVFGMLFGAGIRKTAEIAGISLDLAQQIRDLLFTKFPSIPLYMDQTKWELRMLGLVETFDGGRRRFPMDTSRAPRSLLARAERQAINFKVQRTNSDIVLSVLCWIAEALRDMGGRVLLTVHDSIGFQVPKKYAHQIPDLFYQMGTVRVAKECPWLKSPYRWDVTLGPSYGEQTPAKDYIAGLPPPVPEAELDGYTAEEVFDDLRDPDELESAPPTPKTN
jgi:DNA polymerase I-like protein with 3'-5' exonuclease and polymerase domains